MIINHLRDIMDDKRIYNVAMLIKATGMTRNTIIKLYNNTQIETIKMDTLMKICNALDCSLSELIEYKPE